MSIVRAFNKTLLSVSVIIFEMLAFAVACLAFIGYIIKISLM